MDTQDFLKLFKRRKATVISITLIFVIVGLIITLIQPLKYSAKSRLLILQSNNSTDAYTVSKSNEYVGGLISEVVYSGSFLDSLEASNYTFDRSYFNGTYKENTKKWGETVFARSSGSTGVIDVEIYHTSPEEAKNIANAVNQLIISGQSPYKFDASQTKINVIDEPVVSTFPTKPNIPVNLAISILAGFLAGCSYIYLFPKERISEKIAKELFKEEKIIKHQTHQAPKVVPENLPIFTQTIEQPPVDIIEITEPEIKTPHHFQGNIGNVLGE